MHITHQHIPSANTIVFQIDEESFLRSPKILRTHRQCITLKERTFRIMLPQSIQSFASVHNDIWALIVFLVVCPFVEEELRLSFSVSKKLAVAFEACGKRILPIDPMLKPRTKKVSTQHSVAFNGRMHAFVTAVTLGPQTALVAVDHWDSVLGERTSPYPPDVLYNALDNMESKGHRVCMVKTDVQSMFEPIGFAHPLTAMIGNILLANDLGLSVVHIGCRLDDMSAYGAYRKEKPHTHKPTRVVVDGNLSTHSRCVSFRDHQLQMNFDGNSLWTVPFWRSMMGCVSLKLDFPLCGMTDALLVKLLAEHKLWHEANYCMYARPQKRCGQCLQCMYYDHLHASVTKQPVNILKIWHMFSDRFPEATTSVTDVQTPCRWNMFWLELIRRKDLLPDAQNFDIFGAYVDVYLQRIYIVNSMKHILEDVHYTKVRNGLGRMMGILS